MWLIIYERKKSIMIQWWISFPEYKTLGSHNIIIKLDCAIRDEIISIWDRNLQCCDIKVYIIQIIWLATLY